MKPPTVTSVCIIILLAISALPVSCQRNDDESPHLKLSKRQLSGGQKTNQNNSSSNSSLAPEAASGPSFGPPDGQGRSPPGRGRRCKLQRCKEWTVLVIMLFSEKVSLDDLFVINNFLNYIFYSCDVADRDIQVAYMGSQFRNANSSSGSFVRFVETSEAIAARQAALKLDNFTLSREPSTAQLESLFQNAVTTIKNVSRWEKEGKYIIVVSDFDLKLADRDVAMSLERRVRGERIEVRIIIVSQEHDVYAEGNYLDVIDKPRYLRTIMNLTEFQVTADFKACDPTGKGPPPPPPRKPPPKTSPSADVSDQPNWVLIIPLVGVSLFLLIALIASAFIYYSKTKFKWKAKIFRMQSSVDPHYYTASMNSEFAEPNRYENLEKTDKWMISIDNLEIFYDQRLGSGAFCNVFKGRLSGTAPVCKLQPSIQSIRCYTDCEVAIKMLPAFADDFAKSDFNQEINFMKSLQYHPHLVSILGTANAKIEKLLVIEYCSQGDLLHFIRERKEELKNGLENGDEGLKLKDLLSFGWQIADGLDYLSSKGCIHRDVAARNVLVDAANVCKIGDFGLCRLTNRPLYMARGGRLPVKWMAIESLRSYEFTTKSDVWSFGVLLFELFSFGEVPFPVVQPDDMVTHLEQGNRLAQPDYCPDEIYDLMQKCWLEEAEKRPNFEMIRQKLCRILEDASEHYGYLTVGSRKNTLNKDKEEEQQMTDTCSPDPLLECDDQLAVSV